jgi:hypothetical protein
MKLERILILSMLFFASAKDASAEVFVYDEHDGRSGGTVGWAEDWPFFSRIDGELAQTAGYPRRRFNAPLGRENSTLWVAVTSRMSAPIPTYSYHVPMGTTAWTNAYQHPGLHFSGGVNHGFVDNNNTVSTGVAATTKQTWLARYELGPELPGGRFDMFVSVWTGSTIDLAAPPRYTVLLQATTLDSFYAGQDINGYTHFVDRESVASSPEEALGLRRDLAITAHQDDDLLFMNPDISKSIRSGTPVRTIYITDGEANRNEDHPNGDPLYREQRELGVMTAYAQMAGVGNIWSCGALAVAGKDVKLCTLNDQVSLIFIRLPATVGPGSFPVDQSSDIDNDLERLWMVPGFTMTDNYLGATYTRGDLINVLGVLYNSFAPTDVFTLEATSTHGWDHEEHFYAALFAHAARYAYTAPHNFRYYRGYNTMYEAENVTGQEFDEKWATFGWYIACDYYICDTEDCGEAIGCELSATSYYAEWSRAQYEVRALPPGTYRFAGQSNLSRCLSVSLTGGVVTLSCQQSSAQTWTLTENHQLRAGGQCLELAPNGVDLRMRPCSSSPAQQFTVFEDGILLTGSGACTQVVGSNNVNATAPDCTGSPSQRWNAIPAS